MICVRGICWMTISRDSFWIVLSDLIVTFVGALYFRVGGFFRCYVFDFCGAHFQ